MSSFKSRVSHFFREVLPDLLSHIAIPVLMSVGMRLLKNLRTHFIGVKGLDYVPLNLPDKYLNSCTSSFELKLTVRELCVVSQNCILQKQISAVIVSTPCLAFLRLLLIPQQCRFCWECLLLVGSGRKLMKIKKNILKGSQVVCFMSLSLQELSIHEF